MNFIHRRPARQGTVTVEMAFALPILLGLFFFAFEVARLHMLNHTIDNAVYEATRRGIVPGATAADVAAEAQRILASVGVHRSVVTLSPPVLDDSVSNLRVQLSVPLAGNTLLPPSLLPEKNLEREFTMKREGAS